MGLLCRRKLRTVLIVVGLIYLFSIYNRLYDNFKASEMMAVEKIKILCWVITSPEDYEAHAIHVKATWGKRCDTFLLMSSANDTNPEVIALPNTLDGGSDRLKTKEAFKYIWEHHRHDADWFLKADEDTFVILENLRLFLRHFDTSQAIWFGNKFKGTEDCVDCEHMASGPGYVLSKEAVRRLVEEALPSSNNNYCDESLQRHDDAWIGGCLKHVGVEGGDTRDKLGCYRFLNFDPSTQINMRKDDFWYWERIYYPQNEGMDCCSARAISFHDLSPDMMHTLEYLIYHLRPFGLPN